ncbi:MAG: DNA polymerase III subunit delta' [Johnsonella sp.]|nr:DNA polymerase III subunit delta' [Johnsonella sp.]
MFHYDDVFGQDEVKEYLKKIRLSSRFSHAYIIEGERGMGKTLLALSWASSLLCEKEGELACGCCHSCRQIAAKTHPDLNLIKGEKANLITVGEVREKICEDIQIRPYSGRYKIYLVQEADKMNVSAQNALLKTLEEPPDYAIIILLCDNREGFLETLKSRCIKLKLKPQPKELIIKRLVDLYGDRERAERFSGFARGNIGRAKRLISSRESESEFEQNIEILEKLHISDARARMRDLESLKNRENLGDFLDFCRCWYRDILVLKTGNPKEKLLFGYKYSELKAIAEFFDYSDFNQILSAIERAKSRLEANVNKELVMKIMLAEMKKRNKEKI